MITRTRMLAAAAAIAALLAPITASAQEKLKVLATFSILGDFVRNVGGDRVDVAVLVGPDSDAHVYSPAPADAKKVAEAKVVFVNGLGYEGWMSRLAKASGSKAPVVVATKGIKERKAAGGHGHGTAEPIRMPGSRLQMPRSMSPISAMGWLRPIPPARPSTKPMPQPTSPSSMPSIRKSGPRSPRSPPIDARSSAATTHSAISSRPTASTSLPRKGCRRKPRPRPATSRASSRK